jgi:ubiquinol-cytochrome c reductase cytochrome b subunit
MHYIPDVSMAFNSIEHIMRDVNGGWLLRYTHATGASMFFMAIYLHTFRGLYYGSFMYPRQTVWMIGVALLILMIATAFMGYVLPWGQMSFWAATVITNLFSAIPIIGHDIVLWLWGGFAVGNPTLGRFFSLHFVMPFILIGLVLLHILILHENGSNNPLGINYSSNGGIPFHPYYTLKDLWGVILFLYVIGFFLYFAPNFLGHPDNYIVANPLVTPPHIVPEWYFLPFYAILRSIPDKLGGVIALALAMLTLFLIPLLNKPEVRVLAFRPLSQGAFVIIIYCCLFLGFLGAAPVTYPYYTLAQVTTFGYFAGFFILSPLLISIESYISLLWEQSRHN